MDLFLGVIGDEILVYVEEIVDGWFWNVSILYEFEFGFIFYIIVVE